jgi:hypothetical protein
MLAVQIIMQAVQLGDLMDYVEHFMVTILKNVRAVVVTVMAINMMKM